MIHRLLPVFMCVAAAVPCLGQVNQKQLTPQQRHARANRSKLKEMGIQVSRAQVAKSDAVETRSDVVYAKYGDREMHLDLFLPKNRAKKTAAVVVVHGGGWKKGDRKSFHALSMNLALRGWVTAAIEYRLAPEAKFPAAIHDCNAATRWLRANAKELRIDSDRIAAVGGSAGGHLVGLMGAGSHRKELQGNGGNAAASSDLQAVVVFAGPMQMTTGAVAERSRSQPKQSNSNLWLGKTIDEDPGLYALAAPFQHATGRTPPMLFMAGEHDQPSRNQAMREKLRGLGVRSDVLAYRFGLHGCWNQTPWFNSMVGDVDSFLRTVLGAPGGTHLPLPVSSNENTVAFADRVEVAVGSIEKKTKIRMPRLNNPIGKVYLQSTGEEVKLVPGLTEWDITVPAAASGGTVVVETVGVPHLPVIPRVVSAGADGTVTLPAHDSVTHGELLRYEPQPHKNTVGYWANPDDFVEWHFYAEKPGAYDVRILQGCGKGHGGSEVDIQLGKQTVSFVVEDTGHFQNFKLRTVGQLKLGNPGLHTLKVVARKKANVAVMDVRKIQLVPVRRD